MLNYRGRQLMGLLHSTELVQFVMDLDTRITYDILPNDESFEQLFQPEIKPLEGTTKELYLLDNAGPPTGAGLTYHQWRIEVLTSSTVKVARQSPVAEIEVSSYTVTSGLSSIVPLIGSGLSFRFQSGVGSTWRVTAYSRPSHDLGGLAADLRASNYIIDNLFQLGTPRPNTEPFRTFLNLWADHPELAYQLGAVLLGLIYRTDEIHKAEV